jgi:predicted phage terminase large subunit-like protein
MTVPTVGSLRLDAATAWKTIHEIEKIDLEDDLYAFVEAAWPAIDSANFAQGGYAIQAVCEHLQACCDGHIRNLLINIPPRFSKSTICGTMFPAWVWAQRQRTSLSGPGAQFLHASYAMSLSVQDSVKCRTLIQSEWYQKRWGDRFALVGDMNTKTRFQNDKNGARIAVSVGGTTTGLGGNYLIADDLNNAAEANSDAMIESAINWWDTAWYNRLNDPVTGCRIVIAQRLSDRDISGHVLEKQVGAWTHLCLPMRFEPERSFHTVLVPAWATEDGEEIIWEDPRTVEGELLWPERFPENEVSLLEKTLGPYAAAGQLQQRPAPKGGEILKREWWQLWPDGAYPPMDFVVASLDTAYTTKQENDFSALTVWGVFTGDTVHQATRVIGADGIAGQVERMVTETAPRLMLMDAWAERLQLHDLVVRVANTCRKMRVDRLLIEDKAAGHSVAQELRRLFGHEDWAVQLVNPGAQDKVARVHSIVHLFAEEMIYAPDRSWADKVITQCENFPKGKNDDLVDTVAQAIRHVRDLGMLTRAPERQAEIEEGMRHTGQPPTALYPI